MSTSAERVSQRAAERVEALGASLRTCEQWAERESPTHSQHALSLFTLIVGDLESNSLTVRPLVVGDLESNSLRVHYHTE